MKRGVTLFLLLAAGGLFWAAGDRNGRLLDQRRELRLTNTDPLENAPPLVAFTTVAMGGFRGIVADILWLRSVELQEEGRYFELVQLADWITKLEPRFTSVWAYHAWNLAYNVSVLFNDPRDRWRWVSNGMKLLRDEGIVYNPDDARLLHELGWIFQHKIGGDTDQAHPFYKRAWALEMRELFDGPAPDYAFCTANPDDPAVRRLREEYKLEPRVMEEIDEARGPLDWRLPQAHAIYWATLSRAAAVEDFDAKAAERMIFQSLADAFRRGSLFVNEERGQFIPSPNLALIPRVDESLRASIAEFPDDPTLKRAHANFLREAIVALYNFSRASEARRLFQVLAKTYPDEVQGDSLEAFVYSAVTPQGRDLTEREARSLVDGALYQSAFWRMLGDGDRALGLEAQARLVWSRYMDSLQGEEHVERVGLPPLDELRRMASDKASADLGL
jgi:hypothetical protein